MAISKSLRYQILRRDNNTCRACGRSAPEVKLHVDHVVPEALGGRTEASNLQTLCADCNSGKSATPPDAAQVDQVSADALRWADAQQVVVARMLAEMKGRTRIYNKVDKLWKEYGDVWRPADWRRSIDQFLDAGLPPEMILRAAETALGKQRIRAGDCFKYMCGISWSRINEIRDATKDAVAAPPPPSVEISPADLRAVKHDAEVRGWNQGRSELADEILEYLGADERAQFLQEGRRQALDEGDELDGEEPDGPYLLGRGAVAAFAHQLDERQSYEYMVRVLLRRLPDDLRGFVMARAKEDMDANQPDGYSERELERWAVFCLGYVMWQTDSAQDRAA